MRSSHFAALAAAALLTACGGNLGSGGGSIGGLSGPVAPNVAQAYAAPTPLDRERSLEDRLDLTPSTTSLVLPNVGGFTIAIDLSAPSAAPSGGATASPATATTAPSASRSSSKTHGLPAPAASAAPTRSGVVFRSSGIRPRLDVGAFVVAANPTPAPSAAETLAPAAGDAPSAPASGAPSAGPSIAPSSTAPAKSVPRPGSHPTHRPTPAPTSSSPTVQFKETIFPDYAPKPPSPKIVSPVARVALVRGYMKLPSDVTLASLAAVRFTIPSGEITPGRGFTIAVYDERRKKKPHLIVADTNAVVGKSTIAGVSDDIIELQKGNPYSFVLFADALPPSPPPAGTYNAPGPPPGIPGSAGGVQPPGTYPSSGSPAQPPAGYNQPYGTPTLSGTIPPAYPTFPAQ